MGLIQLATHFLDHLGAGRVEAALSLCAQEVVLGLPFVPGGDAQRRFTGKQQVRARLERAFDPASGRFVAFSFHDVRISELTGQSRVLAEYRSEGRERESGAVYRNTYVTLIEFVDHEVVQWLEYFDPQVVAVSE
jgi:hypothetical protein